MAMTRIAAVWLVLLVIASLTLLTIQNPALRLPSTEKTASSSTIPNGNRYLAVHTDRGSYGIGGTVDISISYLGEQPVYPTHFRYEIFVYDSAWHPVYSNWLMWTYTATTSGAQSYEFSWKIPMNATLGQYTALLRLGDAQVSTTFWVH